MEPPSPHLPNEAIIPSRFWAHIRVSYVNAQPRTNKPFTYDAP